MKEYNLDEIMDASVFKANSFSQVYNLSIGTLSSSIFIENEMKEMKRKKIKEKIVENILSIPAIIESIGAASGGPKPNGDGDVVDKQAKFRSEGVFVK